MYIYIYIYIYIYRLSPDLSCSITTQHCYYNTDFAFLRLISDKLIDLTDVPYLHNAYLFGFCLNSKKSLFD